MSLSVGTHSYHHNNITVTVTSLSGKHFNRNQVIDAGRTCCHAAQAQAYRQRKQRLIAAEQAALHDKLASQTAANSTGRGKRQRRPSLKAMSDNAWDADSILPKQDAGPTRQNKSSDIAGQSAKRQQLL